MNFKKLKKPESKGILADAEEEKKPLKELLNAKKIMLSLRPSERVSLEILAEEIGLGLGPLVRYLLKKDKHI